MNSGNDRKSITDMRITLDIIVGKDNELFEAVIKDFDNVQAIRNQKYLACVKRFQRYQPSKFEPKQVVIGLRYFNPGLKSYINSINKKYEGE